MEIGDSTTRTLSLAADGLLSSQLPPITSMSDSSAISGIRVYPDQESSDQIERTEGFLGKRTRSEALVASGSGSWTLPEVRVPWWNTKTDTLEYAVLPSTTISVGSPTVDIPTPTSVTTPAPTQVVHYLLGSGSRGRWLDHSPRARNTLVANASPRHKCPAE